MAIRKPPSVVDGGAHSTSNEELKVITEEGFTKRPTRLYGYNLKAAKEKLALQTKREAILWAQA